MGVSNLFLFAWGQVFLSLARNVCRQLLVLILVVSVAVCPTLPNTGLLVQNESALAAPLLLVHPIVKPLQRFVILRRLSSWLKGDSVLSSVRVFYYRGLLGCFGVMAIDSLLRLGVPFVGQALMDTASRGNGIPGSWRMMALTTTLVLAIEFVLEPLKCYVQFCLVRLTSRYVVDVVDFILERRPEIDSQVDYQKRGNLIFLHRSAFSVRNIEFPLKLPLIVIPGLLSGWFLWRMDCVVTGVAVLTGFGVSLWSAHWSGRLAEANIQLREAQLEIQKILSLEQSAGHSKEVRKRLHQLSAVEIQQAAQNSLYSGVIDRLSSLILMAGVMLWSSWHLYFAHGPTPGQIWALLALSWNVQFNITKLFDLVKSRLEAEGAAFLLADIRVSSSA